ncbi:MAG: hypothetical protein CMK71_12495 [Pseudomonadaceae bacterium]|nr:hypothetical protein [Pseudomonadaceae bacterium]
MPEYFSKLANGRNSVRLLLVCLAFSIVSSMANRWLYQEFQALSLAVKIPVGVLVAAGGIAGIYVFGVLSYRLNRLRHVAFGLIELVVLIAVDRFVMINLRETGLEPVSGPPVFGGHIACVIFGWVFGFLLAGLDRCKSES